MLGTLSVTSRAGACPSEPKPDPFYSTTWLNLSHQNVRTRDSRSAPAPPSRQNLEKRGGGSRSSSLCPRSPVPYPRCPNKAFLCTPRLPPSGRAGAPARAGEGGGASETTPPLARLGPARGARRALAGRGLFNRGTAAAPRGPEAAAPLLLLLLEEEAAAGGGKRGAAGSGAGRREGGQREGGGEAAGGERGEGSGEKRGPAEVGSRGAGAHARGGLGAGGAGGGNGPRGGGAWREAWAGGAAPQPPQRPAAAGGGERNPPQRHPAGPGTSAPPQ